MGEQDKQVFVRKIVSNPYKYRTVLGMLVKLLEVSYANIILICEHMGEQDKQVFVREIVSNSSDALEKLRYKQLTASGQWPTP